MWYVSKEKGNNKNDGSKENPLKNIDKAINSASPGDDIKVAGGVYMGTLNVGFIESDKPRLTYPKNPSQNRPPGKRI